MASQLYPLGAQHILNGDIDFATANLKILFYNGTYGGTNQYVSDLVAGDIVARSGNLAGVTIANGVLDANDLTVTAVSGAAFGHVILYKDTGVDTSSLLVAIFDIATYTPDGTAVTVVWNPAGLFAIA